jgi:hypothetical protein
LEQKTGERRHEGELGMDGVKTENTDHGCILKELKIHR